MTLLKIRGYNVKNLINVGVIIIIMLIFLNISLVKVKLIENYNLYSTPDQYDIEHILVTSEIFNIINSDL